MSPFLTSHVWGFEAAKRKDFGPCLTGSSTGVANEARPTCLRNQCVCVCVSVQRTHAVTEVPAFGICGIDLAAIALPFCKSYGLKKHCHVSDS